MKELHIHEVLNMMLANETVYSDKAAFVADVEEKFGTDARFYACSGADMDAEEAFHFLLERGKITLRNNNVSIDPDMEMCEGY